MNRTNIGVSVAFFRATSFEFFGATAAKAERAFEFFRATLAKVKRGLQRGPQRLSSSGHSRLGFFVWAFYRATRVKRGSFKGQNGFQTGLGSLFVGEPKRPSSNKSTLNRALQYQHKETYRTCNTRGQPNLARVVTCHSLTKPFLFLT